MTTENTAPVVENAPVEEVEVENREVGGPNEAEQDDYEKLFNEQVAKREAEKSGEPQPVEEVDTTTAEKEADPAPVQSDEGKTAEVQEAPKELSRDDLIAALPEDKREAAKAAFAASDALAAENERLKHDYKSQVGRVAAFQKKYEEAAGKRQQEQAAKPVSPESLEKWKEFAENYPEISAAMEARLAAVQPGLPPNVEKMAAFVEDEIQRRALDEASTAIETVHPDWVKTVQTKEFTDWQTTSPAYAKLASSDDPSDAIALLDLWKASRPAATTPTPVVDPKQAAEAAKLAARRSAQVEGGRAAVTKTAVPNQNVDLNDPDQMWNFYASKSNGRMKARNAR